LVVQAMRSGAVQARATVQESLNLSGETAGDARLYLVSVMFETC